MSHHHHDKPASSNEDGVNLKKIVAVGVVSLTIFAVSAVIAAVILDRDLADLKERGVAGKGALIGKQEIGLVDQVPFDSDKRLEEWRAEKRAKLSSYGWQDRKRGTIHIPIEEAMKEVIRQASGGGAP